MGQLYILLDRMGLDKMAINLSGWLNSQSDSMLGMVVFDLSFFVSMLSTW